MTHILIFIIIGYVLVERNGRKRRKVMIKSMTGFGRAEVATKERKIVVEMKAVNHRYCDISIKIPKKLSFFEAAIRNVLRQYIQRGKVDIFIIYEEYTQQKVCVKYNRDIATEYIKAFQEIASNFGLENDIKVSSLSRYPDVLVLEEQEVDETTIWTVLEEVIRMAAERLVETRVAEGQLLKADIFTKLDHMTQFIHFIELRSPEILKEYRQKLTDKIEELLGDSKKVEESVLAAELILYADKICVDEETVRLRSHIKNMKITLEEGVGIGRKLDFIAQEMNREANTILSKANDLEVSNAAIELKTEIEKIREQIQNIE